MNELTGPDRLVRRWLSAGARGLRWIRRVDLIEVTRTLATETRQSARSLAREPVYFAGVWLTLSIGLTASATMATVVYGVLLRPLPFPAAHELVRFGNAGTRAPDACCSSVSVADFLDIDRRVTSFAGLAAEMPERAVVSSGAFSERAAGQRITPNFLTVLGWSPRIGRNFDVEDGRPGAVSVVIISESMARRHFGGRAPIGQRLVIDLVPSTVIGVMPDALLLPGSPEFWVPLQWDAAGQIDRRHHNIEPIGRLKPGATITQVREELRHVFASLAADYPADDANRTIAVSTFDAWIAGSSGTQTRALMPLVAAAAVAILVIALINVTGLALGRVEHLRRQHGIRRALGATTARTAVHAAADALLVTVPAGLASVLTATVLLRIFMSRYGGGLPRAGSIGFDASTIGTLAVGALTAVVTLAVITFVSSASAPTALHQMDARAPSPRSFAWRRGLVAIEIALSGTLLYGTLLVGITVVRLSRVDLGVAAERALTFAITLPHARYRTPEEIHAFFQTLVDRIAALPGVEAVGATSRQPFNGGMNGTAANVDDRTRTASIAEYRNVTPTLFRALGLRFVAGSTFAASDPAADRHHVIISDACARALFDTSAALGRGVVLDSGPPYEVVGVVSDIRDFGPAVPARPTIYVRHGSGRGWLTSPQLTTIVRVRPDGPAPWHSVGDVLTALDRELIMDDPVTLSLLAERAVGVRRQTTSALLTWFSGVAVALAAVGIFSIVAFSVERRRREFGIRLALGDTPEGIRFRTLRQGVILAGFGVLAALAGMIWMDGLVSAFVVQGFKPRGSLVAVSVLVILEATAILASIVPASRASRISAIALIRAE